jgi:phosphoethanolamine N-methyltransferase
MQSRFFFSCRLFKVLKPGGRLLITDYCRGDDEASEGFQSYIEGRKYDLKTVQVSATA